MWSPWNLDGPGRTETKTEAIRSIFTVTAEAARSGRSSGGAHPGDGPAEQYRRTMRGQPPLQALAMGEAARARGTAAVADLTFDHRLVSPLFDRQGLITRATPQRGRLHVALRDVTGRQTAHGTLTI